MTVAKRDWIFIAVIVVVLGAVFVGKGRMKTIAVPEDEKHAPFQAAMNSGGDRKEIEKGCAVCHGAQGTPLSKGHPPKEQCLICHKLAQSKK